MWFRMIFQTLPILLTSSYSSFSFFIHINIVVTDAGVVIIRYAWIWAEVGQWVLSKKHFTRENEAWSYEIDENKTHTQKTEDTKRNEMKGKWT